MYQYRIYLKYKKYKDGVFTGEVKKGDLLGIGEYIKKSDCEQGMLYQWHEVPGSICENRNLYAKECLFYSKTGTLWIKTDVTRTGRLIELNSSQCLPKIAEP